MKLMSNDWLGTLKRLTADILLGALAATVCMAQGVTTTTVQGTVYLANGQVGTGTVRVSWPAFTTASGQAVAADSVNLTIAPDGFLSVNLAPNLGATPAGLYYTAVYYLSDGTTTTQYWVVPAAGSATLAQVQAQLMPAAQAVQAVSKSYVDNAIAEAQGTLLAGSGGTLTGPLYLSGDPTQPLQAADKHYVDAAVALDVPLSGGNMTGALQSPAVNGVESPLAGSAQTTLQAAVTAAGTTGAVEIPPTYAGTDTFTNSNGVYVEDLRSTSAQELERSVKEFGAVCDGATDDTNALQAALNYANAQGVALTVPQGTCKTHTLNWRGESIGGLGKQVSALLGFPGQDVLASVTDNVNMLSYTRLHDLTIYVDQSVDVSCAAAEGRASAGTCAVSRLMEKNSIFSPGGNGLTGAAGSGTAWAVGNCAIAMPASTGAGGNGLRVAEIENVEIAAAGTDPLAGQYPGAHSTHSCGLYLAQWPQWSEFRNIDIRGLNTGVAIPALPGSTPAGLNADSNRWENVTIQATHAFTAAAGSNNVLDNVVALAGNSAATAEPATGLVLDLSGNQQGWTVRNAVVLPSWNVVAPTLTVAASGGAVTGVTVGPEHGLGFDPYGTTVALAFSGSCTATATAAVNSNGSLGAVTVTAGGVGCSGTTTATVNGPGTWDTAAAVNLIGGQNMTFFAGNLLKGNGGYTVWNATSSQSSGTQLDGGGGNLPGGGAYAALVANSSLGSTVAVDQLPGADFGAKLQACLNTLSATYGGTCDARNFTGTLSMGSNLTIATANASVLLPCATIATANQIIVTVGTRNVSLRGCALRGASAASGSEGGTAFLYSGAGAMVQVGDPTYASNTSGFRMDNMVINTTASTSAAAQAFVAYRAQDLELDTLYLLGNANQTGMTLDGTGNYTGGSFFGIQIDGFQTAVNGIGHQVTNAATTDWMNASTFVRVHIDCPESGGNPIAGTYGINLQQGDGNTFTGGDIEGCSTAVHLGANAQNNTFVGLRNEVSTNQVVADSGSAYNDWMTGGTMYTGALTDNGTRNSFFDTFHRAFNGIKGDWYGSQQDTTITDHQRLGIGVGNERGRLTEYQTDYGYRWEDGFTDGTSGLQAYSIEDLLNNVPRVSIGQYLSATPNVVTNVMVNNGGCYSTSTPPTIGFSGGSGTGAAATAVMTASTSTSCSTYKISAINVTAAGSGYTSQPTVTFTATNQTSAPNVVAEITTSGGTNDQTVINSAGTGAVVLNGSNNSGTGGVVFGSGGATESTVATVNQSGDAQFNGTLMVGGTTQSTGTMTVRNNADAEVDYFLWPGLTTTQKGSLTYKDWNGNSQWYMLKDQFNNWALNSAVGGLDSFKAYQSTNSGDTYVNASNSSGAVRVNYETGSGAAFDIYGGSSSALYASFTGTSTIKFPGLAAGSGHYCMQVDSSGYLTNTGAACGSGTGVVGSGTTGQIAYYSASGTSLAGESSVPVTAGGTGATTAASALTNLGAVPAAGGTMTGSLSVHNSADAEVDYFLQPGLTTSQKGTFTYKDWNGNSQWYMEKDASNNWELNSAVGGLDSFKAYQSSNSGDTYVNASNSSGAVRVNYESGAGTAFNIYGGSSSALYASFTGTTSIKYPGLAAGTGHYCLQVDTSGYMTNTGSPCGTGSGSTTGTINSATTNQIAYYTTTGTTVGGESQVPIASGGTGAATASAALTNLGAQAAIAGLTSDGSNGISVTSNGTFGGTLTAPKATTDLERTGTYWFDVRSKGALCNGTFNLTTWSGHDDTAAFQSALASLTGSELEIPAAPAYGSTCSVLPGQLTVPSSIYTYSIVGRGPQVSTIQDETNTGSGSLGPLLQIGNNAGALVNTTNLRGFTLYGAYGVSYPNGMLSMYSNNLSTVDDVWLQMSNNETNSIGLKNTIASGGGWGEMRFNRLSIFCPNSLTSSGNNTGIVLQATNSNTDFVDSNIESCNTAMDFSGDDGTPLLNWRGGHLERISNEAFGGVAFRIRQAQLQLTGTDLESGTIYLDASTVGSDIAVGPSAADWNAAFVDNGVGNRYRSTSGSPIDQAALSLDGSEQYQTPNLLPDPLFLVSGASGWSKSSSNITVSTLPLTSPGAKKGQAVQISSSASSSDYAYVTTPALTASAEYELVAVLYFNNSSATAPAVSVYDTASGTVIYGPVTATPTMAVPTVGDDWAYATVRAWIPASSSATTWQVRVSPNTATASRVVTLTYLGLNPSSTTMAAASVGSSGGGSASCTSASTYSTYRSATCAISGSGSGSGYAAATWNLSAPTYPTGVFVRMHVATDTNAVSARCLFNGMFPVYFPPNTSWDYNIPLGFWPTSIQCTDYSGMVSDASDMIVSQLSVVPMYPSGVAPITTPSDGKFVQGITPDGVQQRAFVPPNALQYIVTPQSSFSATNAAQTLATSGSIGPLTAGQGVEVNVSAQRTAGTGAMTWAVTLGGTQAYTCTYTGNGNYGTLLHLFIKNAAGSTTTQLVDAEPAWVNNSVVCAVVGGTQASLANWSSAQPVALKWTGQSYNLTVGSGGSGCTSATGLATTTSGSGSGAVLSTTASGGALTAATITTFGSGYTPGDKVYPTQTGCTGYFTVTAGDAIQLNEFAVYLKQ
jgi:hypothetical protein